MSPFVPAPVSVWQLPHFWVKSCWPLSRLAFGPRSQPVRPTTAVAAAMVAISQIALLLSLRRCMERRNPICRGRPAYPRLMPGISLRRTARATFGGGGVEVREGMSSVVLAVGPGHTLRETATKMTEKGTGAALVFDDESPAPRIITERDILNAVGTGKDPDAEKVADHMSDRKSTRLNSS